MGCVSVAGQNFYPEEIYDTRHVCGSCAGQFEKPLLCAAINRVMVPYWAKDADVVSIPTRGYWGQPDGRDTSENTAAAAHAALQHGYRIIELDAVLTGPNQSGQKQVIAGRYFSMRAVGGPANKGPQNYSLEELETFHMRRRDQTLSFEPEEGLVWINDLLTWASRNQVLLLINPHGTGGYPDDEAGQVAAYVLNQALAKGTLANVAVTSHLGYSATIQNMTPYLTEAFSRYEGRFLWNPITNRYADTAKDVVIPAINTWHASTNASRQILTYQLGLFSRMHWSTTDIYYGGKVYRNLIDYVKKLSPTTKRSALRSNDAMGDKGRLTPNYTWVVINNAPADMRGSAFRNLSYELSRHLVFNTDRPSWYRDLVTSPY
jgi:hypothetical protein